MSTTALTPISLDKEGAPMIRTIEDAFRMAEMVFQSGLAPSGYKNAQSILVAWEFGRELGLSRFQSLYNIGVVNGRPAIFGKALPGVVMSRGVLEKFVESIEGDGDDMTAICTVKRKSLPDECTKRFSVADAKRAGLISKDTYQKYIKDMITYRARARAFGTLFGDVLCGLPCVEDMEKLQVEKNERVEVSQQPPAEEIDDPLMKQIGASEVQAVEPKKRGRKSQTIVQPIGENGGAHITEIIQHDAEVENVKSNPVTEESALAAENAHALGVPPEDIPPTQTDFRDAPFRGTTDSEPMPKVVNSPGITVKPEAPVYACRACQDKKVNSKGGPCPICSPKKFDKEEKKESKTETVAPLKNQSETKGPPVEIREVTFEKPPVALGKGNYKFMDDEGLIYYSNATGVKSVVDANIGVKISIGVQEIDSRMVLVSARQIA